MTAPKSLLAQSVTIEGPQDAPALLLVHGIHLGRYSWLPHVRILCRNFRVATIDLPRHGTMYAVPFTREEIFAQLQYAVEDQLGCVPVMIGYSLGGYCITQFAQAFPNLSQGLLLAGCSLDPTTWRSSAYSALTGLGDRLPPPLLDSFSSTFFRMTLKPDLARAIIESPFNRRSFSESHVMLGKQSYSKMLREYPHPVLVANGEYDFIFRPQQKRFIKEARAQGRIVKGSDHVFPLRRPEEFCAIIEEFAQRIILGQQPLRS
ncbi:MAG: alpha/beta fold hydrolase [Candidatus Baltobacteraceae bacterium]